MEISFKLEIILLILILLAIIYGFTFYSCCRCGSKNKKSKEGFDGENLSDYNLQKRPINTASWFTPNLTYNGSQPTDKGIQAIENRPYQQVPLPKNEMLMFANTKFGPEYCPNAYSTSMGCAAMTIKQYDYLINRGGNNVPYSEY